MKIFRQFSGVLLLIILVFQSACSMQWHLKHYSGDGEVKIMPNGGFIQGREGCRIQFAAIKLDCPAHFTYHFTGLPAWQFSCFFVLEGSQKWERKDHYEWLKNHYPNEINEQTAVINDLKGTLAMSLKDANGNIVFQFNRKLSELTWEEGGVGSPQLYDYDAKTWFISNRKEYVLEVRIDPDPMLKENDGYILITGGGREGLSIGF